MKIAKNMEAIFIVAISLACVTALATAASPGTDSNDYATASAMASNIVIVKTVETVKISAKRMTPSEKARYYS
jgi:hypothetical protein